MALRVLGVERGAPVIEIFSRTPGRGLSLLPTNLSRSMMTAVLEKGVVERPRNLMAPLVAKVGKERLGRKFRGLLE